MDGKDVVAGLDCNTVVGLGDGTEVEGESEPFTKVSCGNFAKLSVVLTEDSNVEIGHSSANVATLVARMTDDSVVDFLLDSLAKLTNCVGKTLRPPDKRKISWFERAKIIRKT